VVTKTQIHDEDTTYWRKRRSSSAVHEVRRTFSLVAPGARLERATYCLGGTTTPALCRPATTQVTSERNSKRQLLPERSSLGACLTAGDRSIFRG
jgi:hypothetical protein